mmetsp:Transcript_53733/g.151014  ORF Transcript_53733/g.151014 Transcript_53733/m.151014 type:complete len:80 (+) Transcript_53733:590-829(+)
MCPMSTTSINMLEEVEEQEEWFMTTTITLAETIHKHCRHHPTNHNRFNITICIINSSSSSSNSNSSSIPIHPRQQLDEE